MLLIIIPIQLLAKSFFDKEFTTRAQNCALVDYQHINFLHNCNQDNAFKFLKAKGLIESDDFIQIFEETERFSNWIERQFQYGFIENTDYVGCKEFNTLANQDYVSFNKIIERETGATTRIEYALTIDAVKELAIVDFDKIIKNPKSSLYDTN